MGSNTAVLVSGAALLAASVGLGYMTYASSSNNSRSDNTVHERALAVTEIDEDDDDDDNGNANMITEKDVTGVFEKLFLEMQHTFSQLMTQVQTLQMSGQQIPEAQLKGLIRQEMERALVAKQGSIIEAAGMDADCLEEAVWEFIEQDNARVKASVERFQKVWQNATGENVAGWRPGKEAEEVKVMDAEQTIEAAEVYFAGLTQCMKDIIAQYKSDGKDLKNPQVQQELNMDFARAANDAGEAALGDISQTEFEASVKAHSGNPAVARSLAMLQMKQQQDLASMQG